MAMFKRSDIVYLVYSSRLDAAQSKAIAWSCGALCLDPQVINRLSGGIFTTC